MAGRLPGRQLVRTSANPGEGTQTYPFDVLLSNTDIIRS